MAKPIDIPATSHRKQSFKDSLPRIYACARCPAMSASDEPLSGAERLFTLGGVKSHLNEKCVDVVMFYWSQVLTPFRAMSRHGVHPFSPLDVFLRTDSDV